MARPSLVREVRFAIGEARSPRDDERSIDVIPAGDFCQDEECREARPAPRGRPRPNSARLAAPAAAGRDGAGVAWRPGLGEGVGVTARGGGGRGRVAPGRGSRGGRIALDVSYAGRVAVITGASSGIGRALAGALARTGCRVGLIA